MNTPPDIKDIYIPDGVSIFPLAYGWWVIFGTIVLSILAGLLFLWVLKTSRRYYALKNLDKVDTLSPVEAAIKISELLKRICRFKHKEALALYGQDWIDFLNTRSKQKLTLNAAKLLMYAPFINAGESPYTHTDADEIKHFAKAWIGANL